MGPQKIGHAEHSTQHTFMITGSGFEQNGLLRGRGPVGEIRTEKCVSRRQSRSGRFPLQVWDPN